MTAGAGGDPREQHRAVLVRRAGIPPARTPSRRMAAAVVGLTDLLTLIAGLWLICTPYVLGYAGGGWLGGHWSDSLVGAVIAFAALVRLAEPTGAVAARAVGALLGGGLASAPLLVGGLAPRAAVNDVVVGALVAVLSLAGILALAVRRRTPAPPPSDPGRSDRPARAPDD